MVTAATGATSSSGVITQTTQKQLGKDAFLNLLVTQLKNQDPLQPVDDKEFISQLAQFSSLEQMQAVNQGVEQLNQAGLSSQSQAAFLEGVSLVGKTIQVPNPAYDAAKQNDATLKGKVDSVIFGPNGPVLQVGKETYPLSSVLSVS
jgi:flagellar basal-body rod modification protein FlgD